MIYKTPSHKQAMCASLSSCRRVCGLIRSLFRARFNDWSPTAMPMAQERDGVWRANVELPAGKRYEFRYLVDGRWQTDYHADGCAGNPTALTIACSI